MASVNVFGTPVTEGNRVERALAAYNDQNADGKRDEALEYVRKEKEKYGNGTSTLCIFYNATGEDLIYIEDNSLHGGIYDSYPNRVQNGQWGAFLHVKPPVLLAGSVILAGSVGFVVYRGKDFGIDNDYCKQLLGWDTPVNKVTQDNHAHCDIFDDGDDINPTVVYEKMEAADLKHSVIKKGLLTEANIEEGSSPLYQAILRLKLLDSN